MTRSDARDIGAPVPGWTPPPRPARADMTGRLVTLEPLDPAAHADGLFAAFAEDAEGRDWAHLPYGPFDGAAALDAWLRADCLGDDPLFFAIRRAADGRVVGMASYLRIAPAAGSIEVGHIHFAPAIQGRPEATEAMFLMMQGAFEAGYRRYEWKCDALNARSRRAAMRLGFSFEGVFRQATVVKGRNRDTAWYAAIDGEWPALRDAFETWLAPETFDADGAQTRSLSDLTGPILVKRG